MAERAKQFGVMTGQNLSERFLAEVKSHFENEQGRPSIPTVQGLLLMYLTMTATGKDRAGLIYRLTAYEMLKQLRLEARYKVAKNNVPPQTHDMMLISKTLWGIFLLERWERANPIIRGCIDWERLAGQLISTTSPLLFPRLMFLSLFCLFLHSPTKEIWMFLTGHGMIPLILFLGHLEYWQLHALFPNFSTRSCSISRPPMSDGEVRRIFILEGYSILASYSLDMICLTSWSWSRI
jgi:hypothetical protein